MKGHWAWVPVALCLGLAAAAQNGGGVSNKTPAKKSTSAKSTAPPKSTAKSAAKSTKKKVVRRAPVRRAPVVTQAAREEATSVVSQAMNTEIEPFDNGGGLVAFFERLTGVQIFSPEVYAITGFPSELRWPNVAWIAATALLLTALATVYPALRASRVAPAEALRYE